MPDPYVKSGGVIPRKSGGITRNIGGLANAIKRIQAGSTSGLGNSGGNQGGGGGGGAAAPTALDSLPKTPEIQALIAKGLLRADMAPEQILAIVGMAGQVAGIPIDIAALKAQIAQDYAMTTGNITGMAGDWMQQLYGANMPGSTPGLNFQNGNWVDANGVVQGTTEGGLEDGGFQPVGSGWDFTNGQWFNPQGQSVGTTEGGQEDSGLSAFPYVSTGAPMSQAYANDPMWAGYAQDLAQIQSTAGLNQATDQAWFDKQQQAMTDYYNGLMQSIAMGAGTDTGGGGGGGGGGGRRHGGGGGGGSGGDGDWGFTDPITKSTQTEVVQAKSSDRESAMWPEYKNEVYAAAVQAFGADDPRTQYVLDTLDTTTGPDPALEQVTNDMTAAQATIAAREGMDENNKTWTQAAPASFENLQDEYERITGYRIGDDPNTKGFEWQYQTNPDAELDLASIAPGTLGAQIQSMMSQAYDPENPAAMGENVAPQENFDEIADLFNRILDAGANRRESTQQAAPNILAAIQNARAAIGKGGLLDASASYPASPPNNNNANNTSPTVQQTWDPTSMGGWHLPPGVTPGSVPGDPGNPTVTTGGIASNPPVVTPTGIPIGTQTTGSGPINPNLPPTSIYGPQPTTPAAGGMPGIIPPGGPPRNSTLQGAITTPPTSIYGRNGVAPDVVNPPSNGGMGPNDGSPNSGGSSNSLATVISQLPPEILQAAGEHAGGPPAITDINWSLMQAGMPPLNSQGGVSTAGTYGPSGNSRILPQGAVLGAPSQAPGDFTKGDPNLQQAAFSKLAGGASVSLPGQSSPILTALVNAMGGQRSQQELAQEIADANPNGTSAITGGTIYDQLVRNQVITPPDVDQFGRNVPPELRQDLLEAMQRYSGNQKIEALKGLADPNLLPQGEGQYYEAPPPELSGEALTDAQMVNILAPGLRDMIRAHSTLWDMNPYSRHVDNTGTSTQQLQTTQKSDDPDVANAVAAGNLNDFAAVPDLIDQEYDQTGRPLLDPSLSLGTPYGDVVDVNLGGGGGRPGGLKSMAIRRISKPEARAPITTGKSQLKPGSGKTYSKAKSYVSNTKTPYQPKKKKYSK